MGRILVGTSGYVYADWRTLLYPGVPQKGWLSRYASVFPTVELNGTFYRLPLPTSVDRWREETPPGFVFAAKGSRFLTHNKKLLEVKQGLERYFGPIRRLGSKLEVVLWQLPPQLKNPDPERLAHFLAHLPRQLRHAVEFRSERWYVSEVCDVLDAYGAAFCEHDFIRRDPPRLTGGFRYLRFHGATAKYAGRYTKRRLRAAAEDLRRWRRRGDAYVYFNNDRFGHALLDAMDLRDLLGEKLAATIDPRAAAQPGA